MDAGYMPAVIWSIIAAYSSVIFDSESDEPQNLTFPSPLLKL